MADVLRTIFDATVFGKAAMRREELEMRRAEKASQERMRALEFLKDFRPMLEQAAEIEDPKLRTSTLNDLFAGYQQKFGQQVSPEAVKWAAKNPQLFAETLRLTSEEGLRLDQVFPLLGDPMLRGATSMALEKGQRTRAGIGALAGETPPEGAEGASAAAAAE